LDLAQKSIRELARSLSMLTNLLLLRCRSLSLLDLTYSDSSLILFQKDHQLAERIKSL